MNFSAQRFERIVRASLLANRNLLAVCSRYWQVAVNQFSLGLCKLITGSKAQFMHTLSSDSLMECPHFTLKRTPHCTDLALDHREGKFGDTPFKIVR